ncbi:MAG: DMT family transporter [Gammaproteobacteria bacterium]|nr:DMT family transporter [Gammaproteobacteria bacterium]
MRYAQNIALGAVLIVGSELMLAGMGAAIRTAADGSQGLPNEMIVFLRNALGLLLLLPYVMYHGFDILKTSTPGLHFSRAAVGVSAMYCFFYALANLPLAQGVILKMTTPIFMPLIAYFWLKDRAPLLAIAAIPLGFLGVWLIVNPNTEMGSGNFNLAAMAGLFGGLLAAGAKTNVRKLGETESTVQVVFYFALFATLISAIPVTWAWQTPTNTQWGFLLLIAAGATAGQLMMTRGYAIAPISIVGPFTYSSVIWASLIGYLLWGETLGAHFIIGTLLIIAAGVFATRGKTFFSRASKNPAVSALEP